MPFKIPEGIEFIMIDSEKGTFSDFNTSNLTLQLNKDGTRAQVFFIDTVDSLCKYKDLKVSHQFFLLIHLF